MNGDSHLQDLYRLIDHQLRRFMQVHGGAVAALTKEEEKNILVFHSKVLRQVQEWGSELSSSSEDGMLMIRLNAHKIATSILVLWLKLLHEHFEGFLLEPIHTLKFSQDEILESSPFVVQIFDEESHCPLAHHLKRQAIFLFLRCSFGLINQERESNEECECAAVMSWLNLDVECCARRKGFLELQKWLQDNHFNNKCLENQLNMEDCLNFASSFLHLYVNEACI